ncbi:hypothetical protein [Cellulomonas biazotea]|jgi:hypothetical protein|uniref:Permease n=1 Tax=Cellulomonas biazotea TaxID=1709 RepID=A0A402DMH0_9CELL|nr:hypothetical protein [Cellulomonas biazotea]GCE75324.1 hypothetical protein CBZ_03800 [Cellulomonas biazotea]
MQLATRAVLTAVLAAVVAVAGYLGPLPLAGVCGVLVLVLAVGWPALAGLPFGPGSSVVVALGGLGSVAVVTFAAEQPYLQGLPVVFAGAIVLAFVNELLRRDGRVRLVESVSGTVAGTLVAVAATGWVAIDRGPEGEALVVAGALALAVGSVVVAIHLPAWLGVVVTTLSAAAAGALAGFLLPEFDPLAGGLLGVAVGVLVAALHALFDRMPALERPRPALAVVALPVTVTGLLVYVVGRVLVG